MTNCKKKGGVDSWPRRVFNAAFVQQKNNVVGISGAKPSLLTCAAAGQQQQPVEACSKDANDASLSFEGIHIALIVIVRLNLARCLLQVANDFNLLSNSRQRNGQRRQRFGVELLACGYLL